MNNTVQELDKKRERALRIISTVQNLPSVPAIIFELNKVIENPMASAAQIGRIISKDQGLVTKILKVANSPLYGIPRRVATIDFAVVILGFNQIKNIIIAISMMESFRDLGDVKFPKKEYWIHSIMVASAAKRLADDLNLNCSGEAFTAGLLHDLGLPIVHKYFNKEYTQVYQILNNSELPVDLIEKGIIGLSHCEIAKILIDKWNLPLTFSEAAMYHHSPVNSENYRELVAVVHLADYMTNVLETGNFFWDREFKLDTSIINALNLHDEDYLKSFIETYRELFTNQLETINF
jgi:putative nucleotidyltransferase with HDIG domain